MLNIHRRRLRRTLLCTLCGREITYGEEYWVCNGTCICVDCLPDFARREFMPCHLTRGKEWSE